MVLQSGSVIAELRRETGAAVKVMEHVVHVHMPPTESASRRSEEMRPITIRAGDGRCAAHSQPEPLGFAYA